jgi:hypothetical protein
MPQVGLEPMTPVLERAKTVHALNRAAVVIGHLYCKEVEQLDQIFSILNADCFYGTMSQFRLLAVRINLDSNYRNYNIVVFTLHPIYITGGLRNFPLEKKLVNST